MKTGLYIGVTVALVAGLFLANASLPEWAFAKTVSSSASTCVPCCPPVNSWSTPATTGAAYVRYRDDQGQITTVCPTAGPLPILGEAIGPIVELPFDLVYCLLTGCP